MIFEHVHFITLYEVGKYLGIYLDENATVPLSSRPTNYLLESHLKFLLGTDASCGRILQRKLYEYLPVDKAEFIIDFVHDMLISEVRAFINLDENEIVMEVNVKPNYDAEIVVHELDGAHAVNL